MSKTDFVACPRWKQIDMKKDVGLFWRDDFQFHFLKASLQKSPQDLSEFQNRPMMYLSGLVHTTQRRKNFAIILTGFGACLLLHTVYMKRMFIIVSMSCESVWTKV